MCNETNKIKHRFIFEKCIIGILLSSVLGIMAFAILCQKEDTYSNSQATLTKNIDCEFSGAKFTVKVPKDTVLSDDVLCRAAFHSFIKKDTVR